MIERPEPRSMERRSRLAVYTELVARAPSYEKWNIGQVLRCRSIVCHTRKSTAGVFDRGDRATTVASQDFHNDKLRGVEQAEGLAICVTWQGLAFRRIAALEAMTAIVGRS